MSTHTQYPELGILDHYLLLTMRRSPTLERVRARVRLTSAEEEVAHSVGASLGSGYDIREAQLVEMLGPPSRQELDRLVYDLALWPNHQFAFHRHESGLVFFHGFELRAPIGWEAEAVGDLARRIARLRLGHHTMDEVRDLLGEPTEDLSWGEQAAWLYRADQGMDASLVLMDFRLLTEVVQSYDVRSPGSESGQS